MSAVDPASVVARLAALAERAREPSLTALLVIQVIALFVAWPLATEGLTLAKPVSEGLLILGSLLVVFLSRRRGAKITILVGLAAVLATFMTREDGPHATLGKIGLAGNILLFSSVNWVVGRALFAPGPVTHHRIQGAIVVYLNLGVIFALLYTLICRFDPGAFTPPTTASVGIDASMLYFSLVTLTTTGYGDMAPVHHLARSLANLEAVVGQLFLATTLARLITLQLASSKR